MRSAIWCLGVGSLCLGCGDKDVGVDTSPPGAAFFIRATIDGKPFETTADTYGEGLIVTAYDSAWGEYNIHAQSFTFGAKRPRMRIESVSLLPGPPDQDASFQTFMRGDHPYGTMTRNTETEEDETAGINVIFWDVNEAEWWCSTTRGDESMATFSVISHDLVEGEVTEAGERIWGETTGTFSCTLYSSGGSALELTDGTFRSLSIVMD